MSPGVVYSCVHHRESPPDLRLNKQAQPEAPPPDLSSTMLDLETGNRDLARRTVWLDSPPTAWAPS